MMEKYSSYVQTVRDFKDVMASCKLYFYHITSHFLLLKTYPFQATPCWLPCVP